MRLNPNITQSMIVSRSRTVFPPRPDLLVGSTSLNSCGSFKLFGVMFDSKFTFEWHIRSISSSEQKSSLDCDQKLNENQQRLHPLQGGGNGFDQLHNWLRFLSLKFHL